MLGFWPAGLGFACWPFAAVGGRAAWPVGRFAAVGGRSAWPVGWLLGVAGLGLVVGCCSPLPPLGAAVSVFPGTRPAHATPTRLKYTQDTVTQYVDERHICVM